MKNLLKNLATYLIIDRNRKALSSYEKIRQLTGNLTFGHCPLLKNLFTHKQ